MPLGASQLFEITIVKPYPRARGRRLSRTQSAAVGKLPVSSCQWELVSTANIACPNVRLSVPIDQRESGADPPLVSGELVQLCDGLNPESGDSRCAPNISLPSCSELPDIE